jgi:hypothetical protein
MSAEETRALAVVEQSVTPSERGPLRYTLAELKQIGEIMFASGMFSDLRTVQQAMVKLLAGAELGYGPFASLRAFHVIEGKPTETAGEISARIKRSGKYRMEAYFTDTAGNRLDLEKHSTKTIYGCTVIIQEKRGGKWYQLEPSTFNKEDAEEAGLLRKGVWKQYLRNMLYSRALTNAGRWHCADLFGGPIYTPEELGADVVIRDGEQIVVAASTPVAQAPIPPPDPTPDREQPHPYQFGHPCERCSAIQAIHDAKHKLGMKDADYRELLVATFGERVIIDNKPTTEALQELPDLRNFYRAMTGWAKEQKRAQVMP